ncbi:hypothetical protein [Acidocella sp.]|uniref:hypothetical protein n=1 Tax=Acidocella sp. TaxID=50710 RepID=UPI00262EBAFC|nr:hypothetical protein [Acidocella sp.]
MRRLVLASVLAFAPGLALAQATDNDSDNGSAPPPAPPGMMDGGMMDSGPMMTPAGKGWHHKGMFGPDQMLIDFYAANTSHDGHLTLAQAKAANFKPVMDHFDEIDVKHRGYVTFYDIEAWRLDDFAKHIEAQADALRARD